MPRPLPTLGRAIARVLPRVARVLALAAVAGVAVAARPAPVVAQDARSRIAVLLTNARTAIDDIEYTRAIAICREILAANPALVTRDQRAEALKVLAAAQFPNDADAQRPDSAIVTLRQLIRLDLDATFQRELAWPGLDSLYAAVRSRILAVKAIPAPEQKSDGNGSWSVPYKATQPVQVALRAEARGRVVPLGTAAGAAGAIVVPALDDTRSWRLPAGEWSLVLVARTDRDSQVVTLATRVTADTLAFVPVPGAVDSSRLKPEVARPLRAGAIGYALLLGGATFAIASGVRADAPVKTAFAADGRAVGVAAGLALGAAMAAVLDKGKPLPDNVRENAELRADLARRADEARAENARRLAAATTTVRITP